MPINNFGVVKYAGAFGRLSRSAQPKSSNDYDTLFNVVDIDVVYKLNEEVQIPKQLGAVKHRPVKPMEHDHDNIVRIVEEIDEDLKNGFNVHVHCTYGIDRTGIVLAYYRILKDGWTPAEALTEMKEYGVNKWSEPIHRDILVQAFGPIETSNQPEPEEGFGMGNVASLPSSAAS